VFEQSLEAVELIVIDGGSTDGTQDVLASNAGRIKYWVSERDSGIYNAWNKALAKARGTWILFLGADDRLHDPKVLERLVEPLTAAQAEYRVVYGVVERVNESGNVLSSHGAPWPSVREEFRKGMAIPHQGVFHHRTLFDCNGKFDERYRISGDYELLLRELVEHDALFLPDVVVDMGAGGLSDKPEHVLTLVRESQRARRAHGLMSQPETFWFSLSMIRASIRNWLTRTFGQRAADRALDLYLFVLRRPRPPGSSP
jgi:glycosyltransferase involved in cell wall biosynthesis